MSATASVSRRGRSRTLWVEAALLAPVIGLLALAAVEVRHAVHIESRLASTAQRLAAANRTPQTIALERSSLGTDLNLPVADVQILESEGKVTVRVPYSQTGSALAFFWPTATVAAGSPVLR